MVKDSHSFLSRPNNAYLRSTDSSIDLKESTNFRFISYEELERHNTKASAWIAIRGKVYDVTRFLRYHPGGKETLLYAAGRDATQVFESYHPLNVKDRLSSFYVGELSGDLPLPSFAPPSPLFTTLKERIHDYFLTTKQDPKRPPFAFLHYSMLCFIVILSWYYQTFATHWIVLFFSSLILGMSCALIGLHPLHDASHFTITHSPWVWKWLGSLHDIFNGASHSIWIYQHVLGHHPYTNIPNADPDLTTDFRRLYPDQPWFPFHQYQHVFLPIAYGVLAWKTRLQDVMIWLSKYNGPIRLNEFSFTQSLIFWGGKSMFLIYRVLIPLLYAHVSWVQFGVCFCFSDLVTSYYLAFAFQSNHLVQQTKVPFFEFDKSAKDTTFEIVLNDVVSELNEKKRNAKEIDWAQHQIETTLDYACTHPWVTYFTGSLNFQVVHHLFPGVHQFYYPKLWPLVKSILHEYQIPYLYVNEFQEAFQSHLSFLKELSVPPAQINSSLKEHAMRMSDEKEKQT